MKRKRTQKGKLLSQKLQNIMFDFDPVWNLVRGELVPRKVVDGALLILEGRMEEALGEDQHEA